MISVEGTGVESILARIQAARDAIMPTLEQGCNELGAEVVSQLSEAAPKGQYEGQPPPGDGPGRLASSFEPFVEVGESEVILTIETSQPTKLKFVREGRGPVYPITKMALFWQGLDHPVRYASPSKANDFVTPITEQADADASAYMEAATQALIGMV
jgi:hypothetical protein